MDGTIHWLRVKNKSKCDEGRKNLISKFNPPVNPIRTPTLGPNLDRGRFSSKFGGCPHCNAYLDFRMM